jgi:O-antigen ligase
MTDRLNTLPIVALAVGLAVGLGFALSYSLVATLVMVTVAFVGIVSFIVPASWVAAGSLIFISTCAVLVPVNAMRPGALGFVPLLGSGSPVNMLAFISVALAILSVTRSGPSTLLRGGRTTWFVMAFLLTFVSASIANESPVLLNRIAVYSLWASVFVVALCVPLRFTRPLFVSWIGLAFFEGVFALNEYLSRRAPLFVQYLLEQYQNPWQGLSGPLFRALGTFAHPIAFATFLATSLVIGMWVIRFPASKYLGIMRLGILTGVAIGVLVTFTRGAWIAVVVATIVGVARSRTSGADRLKIIVLCSVPVAAILIFTPLGGLAFEHSQGVQETASYDQRIGSLQSVPALLSTDPIPALLGRGGGAAEELYMKGTLQGTEELQVVDNQYVSILIEGGLLGLSLFIAMLWSTLSTARKRTSSVPGAVGNKTSIAGLSIALLTVLIAIFFYDGLNWPPTAILFWSILGFLARQDEKALLPDSVASNSIPSITHPPGKLKQHVPL